MNDERGPTTESRLAVLEDNMRRVDTRVGVISDRTHTLVSSMQAVTLGIEEAHDQRVVILDKVDDIQRTINTMTTEAVRSTTEMSHHVLECAKRGARSERIQIAVLAAILTLAATVLAYYLTHH